ncbi:MAG: alpha-ketoglutarate-dependent dioxygenase AlkB, partial [Phreatobacter sp.]
MDDLFGDISAGMPEREQLADGALILRGRALPLETALLAAIDGIVAAAPFRRMVTPGGFEMSV